MGLKIKMLRQQKNINQAELGKIVGVGKTTISNYETGYSVPDLETLIKLADYFGVTTDYLLDRTESCNMSEHIVNNSPNQQKQLSENELELLENFRLITNERDQIKMLGRIIEIVEQMTGNFKSDDNVQSTPLKKNVG